MCFGLTGVVYIFIFKPWGKVWIEDYPWCEQFSGVAE